MTPIATNLTEQEFDLIEKDTRSVLNLVKSNATEICNSKAPVTSGDIGRIDVNGPLDHNSAHIILKCIQNLLDEIRSGNIATDMNDEEIALTTGHAVVVYASIYLNWEVMRLKCEYVPDGEVAVISKDQKYALYPTKFLFKLLSKPETDNDLVLSLNMFKENKFPISIDDYEVIMG